MIFNIKAKGHKNVLSHHKSTFEITKDENLTLQGDCIVGVSIDKAMGDFPVEFKEKLANSNTKVIVTLETPNASDKIIGWGHEELTLTHPTDIVCRKSTFTCSRTLMIKSDKAACDLNTNLIKDLQNELYMDVSIKLV
ncbi:MAG: DUF371 domain-containing protein [archaeon]|nr:DUF371 domain-containing protein [archaeon]